ncbi:hypothetical protein [Natronorubrum thiooxidans]|uniref:Uncharacterized protein n=1 Tax=Natronorubrum thiooxidans TaxID=308853 RepID=A0A1N7C4T7_9EURY|nr:hypothetical protein [Natronorubrum thiooxidans]SIR58599.1 hypothetical protein SAMN05421752_101120 [Natronorubrum thiooxidans]
MTTGYDRRRFLQLAGTGAGASLAGCTDLELLNSDDEADLLTVAVGPSQDEVDELIDDFESGEIDRTTAQQREQELFEDAISTFESRAEDNPDLTIEESTEQIGLFRVDADGALLIDVLRDGEVNSIHTASAYDQFLERQQQQPAPPTEPPEDETEDDESSEADDGETSDDADDADESGADAGDEDGTGETSDDQ